MGFVEEIQVQIYDIRNGIAQISEKLREVIDSDPRLTDDLTSALGELGAIDKKLGRSMTEARKELHFLDCAETDEVGSIHIGFNYRTPSFTRLNYAASPIPNLKKHFHDTGENTPNRPLRRLAVARTPGRPRSLPGDVWTSLQTRSPQILHGWPCRIRP